jgi:hypothetical protein
VNEIPLNDSFIKNNKPIRSVNMNKKYVLDIDGSIFSSEEELINYIRKKYVKEFKGKKTDISEIYDILHQHFPDWKVNVENGAGWYAEYIIKLSKDRTVIEQHYANEKAETDRFYVYKGNPDNFQDLIKEISWKIETAKRMIDKIRSIGDFEDIYCKEFDYGYSQDEHHFTFVYKLKEWGDYSEERYYPWGEKGEDEFVNDFKKYFVTKLEGEIKPDYDDGYFNGYTIDGINIDGLVRRARKVRLEIVE